MYKTLRPRSAVERSTKRYRHTAVGIAALAAAGLTLGLGSGSAAAATADQSDPTSPVVVTYTGTMYQFTVPQGVARLHIDALGGDGGQNTHTPDVDHAGAGAEVTGYLNVKPGEVLDIYVGGAGANASTKDNDPAAGGELLGTAVAVAMRPRTIYAPAVPAAAQPSSRSTAATRCWSRPAAVGGGGLSGDPYDAGRGGDASTWLGQNGDTRNVRSAGRCRRCGRSGQHRAGTACLGGSGLGANGGGGGGGVAGGTAAAAPKAPRPVAAAVPAVRRLTRLNSPAPASSPGMKPAKRPRTAR